MRIQQASSTRVVPAVVVGLVDLEADHPGPGPVLHNMPSDDSQAPLRVLPEPYPTGATEERPRHNSNQQAQPVLTPGERQAQESGKGGAELWGSKKGETWAMQEAISSRKWFGVILGSNLITR